ncbi:unnamed protein product [Boreogadus saida]
MLGRRTGEELLELRNVPDNVANPSPANASLPSEWLRLTTTPGDGGRSLSGGPLSPPSVPFPVPPLGFGGRVPWILRWSKNRFSARFTSPQVLRSVFSHLSLNTSLTMYHSVPLGWARMLTGQESWLTGVLADLPYLQPRARLQKGD